jgi:hypothetical protein
MTVAPIISLHIAFGNEPRRIFALPRACR